MGQTTPIIKLWFLTFIWFESFMNVLHRGDSVCIGPNSHWGRRLQNLWMDFVVISGLIHWCPSTTEGINQSSAAYLSCITISPDLARHKSKCLTSDKTKQLITELFEQKHLTKSSLLTPQLKPALQFNLIPTHRDRKHFISHTQTLSFRILTSPFSTWNKLWYLQECLGLWRR